MIEILLILSSVLALVYFSYTAGKNKEKTKGQEDYIDAVQKAKDAISKPSSPESDRLLRMELHR